jgi:O-acetyl-ADP-ribose deacetylase (regulator of RNase III)
LRRVGDIGHFQKNSEKEKRAMAELKYVEGDATRPQGEGRKLIIHVCNNDRKWGSGFVVALSKRWKEPEELYKKMPMDLGVSSSVQVEDDIVVVNMITQEGIRHDPKDPEVLNYTALGECLRGVKGMAEAHGASVHAPRIGAGRSGGDWEVIEAFLKDFLVRKGVDVTIYDLPGNQDKFAWREKCQ